MGDLSKDRDQLDTCISVSGVDLCGPFLIKVEYARRTFLQKSKFVFVFDLHLK